MPLLQGRRSAAAVRRTSGDVPLPWNDTSKPAQKPGPWDAPDEHGGAADGASPAKDRGPRRADADAKAPRRNDPASPWAQDEPAPRIRPPRRTLSGQKPPNAKAPSSPPARGPHLDALTRQLRAAIAHVVLHPSGRGLRRRLAGGALAAGLIAWGLSGVYEVGADESGMVTRFGGFVEETGPGLHYHLPAPIEAVRTLPVGAPLRLDLGGAGPMLTRDGDLVEVDASLQWRIVDPYKYLFQLADPDAALRRATEAALRQAVGQTSFADMTTAGRGGVSSRATALLRAALGREDAGVSVTGVQVRDAQPPETARSGFHDMAAAREDAQIAARDVGAYRDRGLAAARGDAAKVVQASQGYRDQEISEARGEAARFALIDAQARKAPDVTRERLYTEMMERVLHNTNKVIVQPAKGSAGQIVLPPELFRSKPAEPPPQPQGGQPQGQPSAQPSGPAAADTQSGPTA